ncbi:unnamed protein product [Mytilus coruscus]|uniref:Novel STAND NTPase 3 domain-containing protein n=1 Tax=Mytilus coruscus TaxID=42192 RepID=A0A6J8EXQ9_MYTCO|nr:unnamed protein product [Mytilus coruscus]
MRVCILMAKDMKKFDIGFCTRCVARFGGINVTSLTRMPENQNKMSLALVLILSKMNLFVSVLNASLIIVNAAQYEYDLMCPHKSHLMLRATTQKCDDQEFYHCLYDINTKKISEKCFRPDDYPQGYHGVLSGKLHAATCSDGYFAPKIPWSYDGFKCPYQKSVCSEEGQIVVNNGSNKEDIKCRCDYRKGYAFIRNPQNKCTCSPWTEDCSCHHIEIGKVTFSIVVAVGIMLPIGTYVSLKLWYMYKRKLSKVGDIKFFLKTVHGLSNFQILRETLKQKSIVVLKGRYGTGKTTIAKCLQLPFCGDRCRIVYIKAKELDKIGQTPNYIITDSLGNEMSFDSATIPSFIDIRKTKLVFEVDHDTPDLTDFLKKIVNNPQEIIWDLGEKDFYTTEDKKNILTLQINKYEVSIEDDSNMCQPTTDSETMTIRQSIFTALLTENPFLGFPLMCAEICSHKDHLHLGLQYFRQPPNNLVSKLDKLRNEGTSDKCCAIQYCLLVSMLLSYGQETSLDDIIEKSFSKIMQTIYPDKWQSYQTEKAKDMASYLIPEYIITEDNSTFKFSHGAIYLAVMISFGRKHPLSVLRECKVRDIIFY